MPDSREPLSSAITGPQFISFNYVWPVKISLRTISVDDSVILHVSPKFATVYDHVSFQWSLKIHGTTGGLCSDEEIDSEAYPDENVPDPANYVAVELYYVDGPVNQIDVNAKFSISINPGKEPKEKTNGSRVEESKMMLMQRGLSHEMTHADRAHVSEYIMENVGNSVRVSVTLRMESRLFDPFFYLDASTPTPQESFLTANYKARVNSKVWKKRTKRVHQHQSNKIPRHEKVDYEERFRMVMDAEEQPFLTVTSEKKNERRKSLISLRRSSTNATITDQLSQAPDHDHLFKKLLIACCDSCRRRRASSAISNPEDSQPEPDNDDADDEDEEEPESFECNEQDKEHVHDLLANMYFNKMVLPHMEYVEDFVDFLIDAELNDLPVLKRACERYLCGELNLKKDLATSLILDLLFMSIVFHLPVMKSMTLSELSYPTRAQELADPEKLLEQDEYRSLDKRMRTLSDRNLIELIEQCAQFREQRLRVTSF